MFFIPAADYPSLRSLAYSLFPQQVQMELFVENLEDKERFHDEAGNFLNMDERPGVLLVDGNVSTILFWVLSEGALDFGPLYLIKAHIDITTSKCSGKVPWKKLRNEITYFGLVKTQFNGTIDLSALPRDLLRLFLCTSAFSGTLDFGRLPQHLVILTSPGTS